MSAMADFARMPTRQKVMTFVVIGMLLGLLYWQFVYKGLKADLESADIENATKNTTNANLEKDIPRFEQMKQDLPKLQREIEENMKALPTEAELPAFFETLNRKVIESGVEVVRSKQLNEEKVDRFIRVPVEYEISGTYNQIKKFFASLVSVPKDPNTAPASGTDGEVEEQERIVSVENLSLANPTVRNREIVLTAKFVASTYRMEDASATAPAPKKATVAPGAGSGSAMPPAATPAGAKARTDNAMDKNQQRNDKAGAAGEGSGSAKAGSAAGAERMKGGI